MINNNTQSNIINNLQDRNNVNNVNSSNWDVNAGWSDNFIFPLNKNDTIFTLTRTNGIVKDGLSNIISKIFTIKEDREFYLDKFSQRLGQININKILIFSINNTKKPGPITKIGVKDSNVLYIDLNIEQFIHIINDNQKFKDYNKDSLYILRGGNFLDIKNLFTTIENCKVNIGRWRLPEVPRIKSSGL